MTSSRSEGAGWRLGVEGLGAREAGLVRALLALTGSEPGWRFVGEGHCDALVVDAAADAARAQRERGARAVLLLGECAAHGEALPRPLRADQFESWLHRAQARLEIRAALPPVPRYRLLRWPPAQLLRSEPRRTRMATLLTRRALSAAQLAQLSGGDETGAQRFLHLLQGFGLLLEECDASLRAPRPAATHPPASQRWAHVRRIPRSLGL